MHLPKKIPFRDQLFDEISLELLSNVCCLRRYHQSHHACMKVLGERNNTGCKEKYKGVLTFISLSVHEY